MTYHGADVKCLLQYFNAVRIRPGLFWLKKKHLYLVSVLICLCGNINMHTHTHTQTHRVPLGAALPEEYKRPDGGLWLESCSGSERLTFLMTLPEVGLACLLRAVTWHTHGKQKREHKKLTTCISASIMYHKYFCIHYVKVQSKTKPTSSVFLLRISSCCLFWASSSFSWCCDTNTVKQLMTTLKLMVDWLDVITDKWRK